MRYYKSISEALVTELNGLVTEVGVIDDYKERNYEKDTTRPLRGGGDRAVGYGSGYTGRTGKEVSASVEKNRGYLSTAVANPNNEDLDKLISDMASCIDFRAKDSDRQRFLNAMQAVVRNPILRGDYGGTSAQVAEIKGFNKALIWTGQFFDNIRARFVNNV